MNDTTIAAKLLNQFESFLRRISPRTIWFDISFLFFVVISVGVVPGDIAIELCTTLPSPGSIPAKSAQNLRGDKRSTNIYLTGN